MYLPDEDKIYFKATKEHLHEVISSYANGNYRSAVVMLYSVVLADILLKLKELVDIYQDEKAQSILNEINPLLKNNDISEMMKWETKLIKLVKDRTQILSLEGYQHFDYLKKVRNSAAHPSMDDNYELISPTKYETIALIENAINDVLSKPSILIDNIVSRLTDDLDYRKKAFWKKDKELAEYLNKYYFSHLNENQKWKLFKNLWKFCFCKENDEKCNENRVINRKALIVLTESIGIEFLRNNFNESEYNVSHEKYCAISFAFYLSFYPCLYSTLSEGSRIKILVDEMFQNELCAKILFWHKFSTIDEHLEFLKSQISPVLEQLPTSSILRFKDYYMGCGNENKIIKFFVEIYVSSGCFKAVDNRFSILIEPYLEMFSCDDFENLFNGSNNNYQIYANWNKDRYNDIIMKYAKRVLGEDYNFAQYQNLNLVDTTSTEELAQVEDDKIPF